MRGFTFLILSYVPRRRLWRGWPGRQKRPLRAPPARSGNILAAEQPPLTPEPLQTMHDHIGLAQAEMPAPLDGHEVNADAGSWSVDMLDITVT